VLKVIKVLKVLLDHKEVQVIKELKDIQVLKVLLVHKEDQVPQVLKVI
jgi:hypothetical protein